MNQDFQEIHNILTKMGNEYELSCTADVDNPEAPVTERDIVAEIYSRLKGFCREKGYNVHCEMKPAVSQDSGTDEMRSLPRIDVVVLANQKEGSWLSAAKALQSKYKKGLVEARFSSVPVSFFHSAIEAKIQSNLADAKKDINTLSQIREDNPSCNCFFVLLNARGRKEDHERIVEYAKMKDIPIIEYSSRRVNVFSAPK